MAYCPLAITGTHLLDDGEEREMDAAARRLPVNDTVEMGEDAARKAMEQARETDEAARR